MSYRRREQKRGACVCWLTIGGLCVLAGCQEPGYRTEVVSGQEGSVQVKKVEVPNTPQQRTAASGDHSSVAPAAEPAIDSNDSGLTQIQVLWPALSNDDRQKLVDTAHQMAGHNK